MPRYHEAVTATVLSPEFVWLSMSATDLVLLLHAMLHLLPVTTSITTESLIHMTLG